MVYFAKVSHINSWGFNVSFCCMGKDKIMEIVWDRVKVILVGGQRIESIVDRTRQRDAIVKDLNRYHINGIQFYDCQYDHHRPLALVHGLLEGTL